MGDAGVSAIKQQVREHGVTVFFANEAGIRSDYDTGTTWAPAGQMPVVTATDQRFSLNMLSAVSPKCEFRFMLHDGTVTAQVFKTFLQRLMVGVTNPVVVVVDGHPPCISSQNWSSRSSVITNVWTTVTTIF
jgi:hypothetical protein